MWKRKIAENLCALVQPVGERYYHQSDKASKYRKGSKTKEKMICCAELRVDKKIRQLAIVKYDSKSLSITSDELVVKEAKYHFSFLIRTMHVLRNN